MQNRRGPPKRVGRLLSGLQLDSCGDASGRTAAGRNAGSDQLHRHGALADLGGGGGGTAGVARQSESSRSSRATGHQGSSGHLSKDDQTPCVPPKTPAMGRTMTLKLMPFDRSSFTSERGTFFIGFIIADFPDEDGRHPSPPPEYRERGKRRRRTNAPPSRSLSSESTRRSE